MKIIALNGSPRPIGNTSNILNYVKDLFEIEGIQLKIVHVYEYQLMNCNVCLTCEIRGDGRCLDEQDGFNELIDELREVDGIILASPTYAGACPSMMQTFLERASMVLRNGDLGLSRKIGGAIAVHSHNGACSVYNQLVNFMLCNRMTVCGSNPLPIIRALNSPQYTDDKYGMNGVQSLVYEMSYLMHLLDRDKTK